MSNNSNREATSRRDRSEIAGNASDIAIAGMAAGTLGLIIANKQSVAAEQTRENSRTVDMTPNIDSDLSSHPTQNVLLESVSSRSSTSETSIASPTVSDELERQTQDPGRDISRETAGVEHRTLAADDSALQLNGSEPSVNQESSASGPANELSPDQPTVAPLAQLPAVHLETSALLQNGYTEISNAISSMIDSSVSTANTLLDNLLGVIEQPAIIQSDLSATGTLISNGFANLADDISTSVTQGPAQAVAAIVSAPQNVLHSAIGPHSDPVPEIVNTVEVASSHLPAIDFLGLSYVDIDNSDHGLLHGFV